MPEQNSLKCPTAPRYPGDLVGCGSAKLTGPDHEGLYDCCDCGLFFTAEAASAQTEQGETNAA
jgi:hypothetical protein